MQGSKRSLEDVGDESPTRSTKSQKESQKWHQICESESEGEDEILAIRGPTGVEVDIQILPNCKPPQKGSEVAAGHDIRANQSVTLVPGQSTKVNTGLRAAIPKGWCMLLYSRSKLATEGITVEDGLIESDYCGPIQCMLHNHTQIPRRIQKGEHIYQALTLPIPIVNWQTVSYLDDTSKDNTGFGSTGAL
jgi:dUTP pyrophosphatase